MELAVDRIPVAVTCRVLGFSKQAFYKWLKQPMSDREWNDAHVVNAVLNIHHNDPMFGYRFITDELHRQGLKVSEDRVHRLCQENRVWSMFAKKRGASRKPSPPVHDDLVRREFSATSPNMMWLTDITEHPTTGIQATGIQDLDPLQMSVTNCVVMG